MMGVVYRDLKPENVLVRDDGHIMLSDFDLSLKCHVVPRLLRQRLDPNKLADDVKKKKKKNINNAAKGSTSSSCVPPMQPVLSCFFYAGTIKKPRPPRPAVPAPETDVIAAKEKLEYYGFDDPELVAEPVAARSRSFVGTHEYLAPEVISGTGHGSAVDWWTLGVFLYEMMYGRTPFKGDDNEKTLVNIIKQPLTFPKVATCRKELDEILRAQDLISKLLMKNPKRRIGSLKGAAEIKRHEFFKGVNWALIRSVRPPEVPRDLMRRTRSKAPPVQKLGKKRDERYHIPQHFDFF